MGKIEEFLNSLSEGRDQRTTPARGDVAASFLKGRVEAETFSEGETRSIITPHIGLRPDPHPASRQLSELLYGETFLVLDEADDWAWGQCAHDRYVGYIPTSAIGEASDKPTHRVWTGLSHVYPKPKLKAPPITQLPLGAAVHVGVKDEENGFLHAHGLGWIYKRHLSPIAEKQDHVDVASMFSGAPYLWGGRTANGIDCSGLVQVSLMMAGVAAPRDTDLQQEAFEIDLAPDDIERGDLVFFEGHVGIMVDGKNILHANAFHMKTLIEPLKDVIARIADDTGKEDPVTGIGRI